MRSGDFNRRITIQVKQAGQDDLGQPLTSWVDVAAGVPAYLLASTGRNTSTQARKSARRR